MERRLNGPTIRAGRPSDLDALERIELAAFVSDRLSRRSLRYFLAARSTDVAVATEAEEVVGYAMIGFRVGSSVGRIFSLAAAPDRPRRGIGRVLLRACEAAALARGRSMVRLEVRTDNTAAEALYRQADYVLFGHYDDFYEDGATALRFEKILAPEVAVVPGP